MLVLCVAAAWASSGGDTWWLEAWPYRQVVEVTTPDPSGAINTALAVVDTDGKCLRGGGDIRVVEAGSGRSVKYHVSAAEEGVVRLEFLVTDPATTRYHIYYGNPEAAGESHLWERKLGGLSLTTYVNSRRQSAQSWRHMQEMLSESNWKYGTGPRKQVFDVDNPFGPDDYYVGVYKGKLYCREDGTYLFATNSDDSSFMLIDGVLVAQFPGGHDPLPDFDEKDGRAGQLHLKRGIHAIEYYHVEVSGAQLAKAGWKPPGATQIKAIPEEAFVRELRTATLARQTRGKALDAFFVCEPREEYQFTTLKDVFVTLDFVSRPVSRFGKTALWWWEFGDGGVSREANPRHQFKKEGAYTVRHYCVDSLGYRDVCERRVVVKAEDPTRVEPLMEVVSGDPVLKPAQPVRLVAKWRCAGTERWPCDLVVLVTTPRGRVVERKVSPVVLSSKQWQSEEKVLEAASGSCAITFRLEFGGTALLERTIHVLPAESRAGRLRVVNKGLVNEQGENVLLRLSESVVTPPIQDFLGRLRGKAVATICVVDDSLAPQEEAEKDTYYGVVCDLLLEEFPDKRIVLKRLGAAYVSHHDPLERLGEIPAQVAALAPDLVIVAGSVLDLKLYVPPDSYERYLYALVDRLRGSTDGEILLVTPPPIIMNPGLSREYAERTVRVGLRRGLKVADAYSAFARRGDGNVWQNFFRDPHDPDVFYLQPNRDGQRLIAGLIVKALLGD